MKTLMQKVIDTLEAGGISVLGIDQYFPDSEEGSFLINVKAQSPEAKSPPGTFFSNLSPDNPEKSGQSL